MSYSKPEITSFNPAIAAIQSSQKSNAHIDNISMSSNGAYEADE
jgi:hypothetical protein